jgi:asparagine synthase (glutamine-hydrolysing)
MASIFLLLDISGSKETAAVLHGSLKGYEGATPWDLVDEKTGCSIISDARIDYRQELAGKIGVEWNEAEAYSDSAYILKAYLKWGEECLLHLYGDFSFVLWDPGREEILCARDHFGCRPLYYVDQPGFLAVASRISAFKSLPAFSFEISEQYILDAMCSIVRADSQSAYKGIHRLKPAHYFKQKRGKSSGQYRYWDLKTDEAYRNLTLEEASEGLRDRIIEAIRQRSRTAGQIGVELSGGLDSSGIAAILAMLSEQNGRINAFTHAISAEDAAQFQDLKSEMEFSSVLAEKYSSIRQFQITGENSEGSYSAIKEAVRCLYKPVNLHYALNSDLLFKMAGDSGTAIMFSGLGGDEGITNDGSGYFNELISQGRHSELKNNLKSTVTRRGGSFCRHLIKIYINYYAPWLLTLYKQDWRKAAYKSFAPEKRLARKYKMKRRFLSSTPLSRKPDVRAMQYFRIMYPSIPERIEETSLLAQEQGIAYSYPFLDRKLLEFFFSLPSDYKYKDGMGRYLFRMAMKGILPEKIRMRTDKGGNTIPNVFARVLKDEEVFRKLIEEGRMKNQYHYVDYEKLHEMLDSFKKTHQLKGQEYGLKEFQSPMSVLILQKWQREGKMDIGIKC